MSGVQPEPALLSQFWNDYTARIKRKREPRPRMAYRTKLIILCNLILCGLIVWFIGGLTAVLFTAFEYNLWLILLLLPWGLVSYTLYQFGSWLNERIESGLDNHSGGV